MGELKIGSTRIVFLIGNYAIKLPYVFNWFRFLCGLQANMQEREWGKMGYPKLCPVVFSTWGGWLVVMRRAEPISDKAYELLGYDNFIYEEDYIVPVENKQSSFGILDGKIVAVDYGS